jgi:hypothetical protein
VPHVSCNILQAFFIELQTVVHRIVFVHASQIKCIARYQLRNIAFNTVGNSQQYFVAFLIADGGKSLACFLYFFELNERDLIKLFSPFVDINEMKN